MSSWDICDSSYIMVEKLVRHTIEWIEFNIYNYMYDIL